MRHRNRRGKLGRKSEHRMMMLRNMATSLFDRERIQTTMPKAKQLRPFAEKLITLARKQDVYARRLTQMQITNKRVLKKLFNEIAKRYADSKGGYTRIIAYRPRWGDGAQLAFIELTKSAILEKKKAVEGKKKKAKKKEEAGETAEKVKPETGKKKRSAKKTEEANQE